MLEQTLVASMPQAHANDVNCVQFCPSNNNEMPLLASCSDDQLIKLWKFNN